MRYVNVEDDSLKMMTEVKVQNTRALLWPQGQHKQACTMSKASLRKEGILLSTRQTSHTQLVLPAWKSLSEAEKCTADTTQWPNHSSTQTTWSLEEWPKCKALLIDLTGNQIYCWASEVTSQLNRYNRIIAPLGSRNTEQGERLHLDYRSHLDYKDPQIIELRKWYTILSQTS